ncbi:MAG TPA: hypothetical protein VKN62_03220 [Pelovirga sp.]|nr:hypothetical protein [Pelovirga sp.]
MDSHTEITLDEMHAGLRIVRMRRWFLWLLILAYVPLMMFALAANDAKRMVVIAFVGWLLLLIVAVAMMALARCPRCGHCFHMSGYLFRPVRRCFECDLHLTADKRAKKDQAVKSQHGSGSDREEVK